MSQPPIEDTFAKLNLSNFNVDAKEFVPFSKGSVAARAPPTPDEPNGTEDDKSYEYQGSLEDSEDIADNWMEAEAVEADVNLTSDVAQAEKPKRQIIKRDITLKKEPVNVVFCGHVDAGKSTIGGQLMYLTGMVDKRTLEKYEKEAREKNRESWYLSWALDINEEERSRGKTVEVGRAYFETEKKHFIILDAPGHKCFVPNMIGGASQADIAILVISARKGEFETGFEKGGQTREHAMLVKTAGVKYLIVLVNKMDDPTVKWSKERYDDIKEKLTPYLKKCGFQPSKDLYFIPCSGLTGAFLKDRSFTDVCPWYKDLSLIEYLDSLPTINRTLDSSFRMPIVDRYKDMGTIVIGKVESGIIRLGDKLTMMPNKKNVEILNVYIESSETDCAICGENIRLKLKGIEEDEISPGSVLCSPDDLCHVGSVFDAQVVILDYKSIICPGYNAVMHLHTGIYEIQLKNIICLIDKKTGEKLPQKPRFIKQENIAILRLQIIGAVACMETFKKFSRMGRFTIRDEAKTVAVGKILKIIE